MSSRRGFLRNILAGAGAMASARVLSAQEMDMSHGMQGMKMKGKSQPERGHASSLPVETPDVSKLPWRMDGNVKEFHLIAEPVKQEIFPGRIVDLWGYNGSAPGPTIQVNQGDSVRIIVDNHLPEATSMHWHGFEISNEMDGAPGSSQDPIPPGGRFVYEFTLHQEGTYFYHSHMAMQEMMGMIGAFIMHPKEPYKPRADKDFAIIMQEYAILPNIKVRYRTR
jgi:FtsP/CotA-like multicopper oxidase with cupredoxin domain